MAEPVLALVLDREVEVVVCDRVVGVLFCETADVEEAAEEEVDVSEVVTTTTVVAPELQVSTGLLQWKTMRGIGPMTVTHLPALVVCDVAVVDSEDAVDDDEVEDDEATVAGDLRIQDGLPIVARKDSR